MSTESSLSVTFRRRHRATVVCLECFVIRRMRRRDARRSESAAGSLRQRRLHSMKLVEAAHRLEYVGGDFVVVDGQAEALLERVDELNDGQRVELGQAAEQRRRVVQFAAAVFDAKAVITTAFTSSKVVRSLALTSFRIVVPVVPRLCEQRSVRKQTRREPSARGAASQRGVPLKRGPRPERGG